MKKALIVSDGKKGHLNQSIAFCNYLDIPYEIVDVRFKNRFFKWLSYLLDHVRIYTLGLLHTEPLARTSYSTVVCAGSGTYYAAKCYSEAWGAKSIAMMLPKGYSYDFDLIFAQIHDNPPRDKNILPIPANFSYVTPQGIYVPKKKQAIGIVIGGDNKVFTFSAQRLKKQLDTIQALYPDYEVAITTSPRTSSQIETLIEGYGFAYEVIFSKNPINPIPDFLAGCETVFITADSTSMISEAISYGQANVVVLPLDAKEENKFTRFVQRLKHEGYLDVFDGTRGDKNRKIDFRKYLQGI